MENSKFNFDGMFHETISLSALKNARKKATRGDVIVSHRGVYKDHKFEVQVEGCRHSKDNVIVVHSNVDDSEYRYCFWISSDITNNGLFGLMIREELEWMIVKLNKQKEQEVEE